MADDGTEELLKNSQKESLKDSVKEYFIEFVRARPVLYSKSHKDFKDSRKIKRNYCDEMVEEHPTVCGNWKSKTIHSNEGLSFY